jgi:hypothetical protein
LSKEDQGAFDRLFDRAKMHTSAGVYMACPWPMDTILLSILLEPGKMIEKILGKPKEMLFFEFFFGMLHFICNLQIGIKN